MKVENKQEWLQIRKMAVAYEQQNTEKDRKGFAFHEEASFSIFCMDLCSLFVRIASRVVHVLFLSRCSKWAYEDIREVHKRRYLFQVCFVCLTAKASDCHWPNLSLFSS